jgi:hypothetical protein
MAPKGPVASATPLTALSKKPPSTWLSIAPICTRERHCLHLRRRPPSLPPGFASSPYIARVNVMRVGVAFPAEACGGGLAGAASGRRLGQLYRDDGRRRRSEEAGVRRTSPDAARPATGTARRAVHPAGRPGCDDAATGARDEGRCHVIRPRLCPENHAGPGVRYEGPMAERRPRLRLD